MATTVTSQIQGITINEALKAPVRVVTSANITLAGLQTISGVALADRDRVLVKNQSTAADNGIYNAGTGSWQRSKDFDGNRDVVQGALVVSNNDTSIFYRLTTANPITIGTTSLTFEVVSGSVTQGSIGAVLYPVSSAETSAGLTSANLAMHYFYGDIRRYLGAGDGVTSDNTALQNALTGNAGAYPVRIPRGSSFYSVSGRFTAPANTQILMEEGAELRWSSTTATGTNFLGSATRPGIEVTGDNFILEGYGILRGPTSAAYVSNEVAIFAKGTSTAARKSGLTIRGNIEILNWGAYGVLGQFVDDIDLSDPGVHIHGIGYTGALFASCNHGRVRHIHVGDVTPGTAGNAYGISLSHDSTNYSSDPNAGTKSATNPFCWDWIVEGCTVYDIPLWRGLDAHGGYEVHFRRNNIYNCGLSIGLSSSSGDASNYAGADNSVVSNRITSKRRDGSATQITTNVGAIIVNGGSVVAHQRVTVIDNDIDGYGETGHSWDSITAVYCTDALIHGNRITNWAGYGIYSYGGNGIIANNIFGPVSNAASAFCIRLDSTFSGEWSVLGNRHRPISGTTAAEGLRITSGHPRCVVDGNDFDVCGTPYSDAANLLTKCGSQLIPRIEIGGTPTTINVGPAGTADRVWVECSPSGTTTVTDLTDGKIGTIYILHNTQSSNLTFDRTNAALPGGANAVLGQHDTLVLLCIAAAGTKFVALGPVNANS